MRSFPFTADVYFSLFETYNSAIWPAQLVAYVLGIVAVFLALRPLAAGGRIAFAVLSVFWLWNGIAYHLLHFLQINFAALGFGALFALQGVLFAGYAIGGGRALPLPPRCLRLERLALLPVRAGWSIRCSAGLRATAGRGRQCSAWRRRRPRSSPSACC